MKNTTLRIISDLICPHYCSFCGKIGTILCECCKNDLIEDHANQCLACGAPIHNHCPTCDLPFSSQWTASPYDPCAISPASQLVTSTNNQKVRQMIKVFKYQSIRDLGIPLASLLCSATPHLPKNTIVVPAPTIRHHIRERGFDHTFIIAQEFARQKGLTCQCLVGRAKNTVQVGAIKSTREAQAKTAYRLIKPHCPAQTYLVIDDIWTTGASMRAICGLLKKAGAHHVMCAVIARSGNPPNPKIAAPPSPRQSH